MHDQNERPTPVAADVSPIASPGQESAPNGVPPPLEGVNELFAVAAFRPTAYCRIFTRLDDAEAEARHGRERRRGDHVIGRFAFAGTVPFCFVEPAPEQPAREAGFATLEELEREHILRAVAKFGNMSKAALALGIDRRTLYRKMDEYRRGPVVLASPEVP